MNWIIDSPWTIYVLSHNSWCWYHVHFVCGVMTFLPVFTGFCTFLPVYTVVMCETVFTWYKPNPAGMYFAVHNPSLMHVAMKVAAFRLNFRDCSCVFAAETPPPPYQVVHPSSPGQGNTNSCQESKPMDTSGPAAPMHHHSSKSHPFRMYWK